MTPDQWAELERLFHEVRNRSPDDTETFLTVACPDVEVRAELRRQPRRCPPWIKVRR